ncbi:hypothetical protein AUJ42_03610 [Candidatus Collierbacteria bacterium CG1_02_44_10]|uniref:Dihydrofolate reductase n=1 Tax=Candidatus Collierbacteria bacterium CG1_02_44_10 TaxID=1805087 RepID=A0A1J4RRZ7_9BACT|nr:MAG: hypothetical protein AUJ42_03610 [Candidatus Collierbacteria bacterium CG1_02_44_10]
MTISAIAAIGKNRELGKNGDLVWRIPEDMKFFKEKTTGHPVIMGRKTFESLPGGALRNRTNIVVTRNADYHAARCVVVQTIEDAISEAKKRDQEEIFIIGGGEIYRLALPYTDKLYLTVIDRASDADAYFPEYEGSFKKISEQKSSHRGIPYSIVELER